jgi:hypothetical protein
MKDGRFLTRDPLEEVGDLNLYAFCRNDAVGSFDPLGFDRLSLTYDFLTPAELDVFQKMSQPKGTVHVSSMESIVENIKQKVDPYNPDGKGKCNCIERLTISAHGLSPGVIPMGGGKRFNVVDAPRPGEAQKPVGPKRKRDIDEYLEGERYLRELSKRMCQKNAKVVFVVCDIGADYEGALLEARLRSIFGQQVEIMLPQKGVAFLFGHVVDYEKKGSDVSKPTGFQSR